MHRQAQHERKYLIDVKLLTLSMSKGEHVEGRMEDFSAAC